MFINLTKHPINYFHKDESIETFEPSGTVVLVEEESYFLGTHSDYDYYSVAYGDVKNLPDPATGITYIVGGMVLSALREQNAVRQDLVAPHTGKYGVRNDKGQIIGTRGWVFP